MIRSKREKGVLEKWIFGWKVGIAMSICIMAMGVSMNGMAYGEKIPAEIMKAADEGWQGFLLHRSMEALKLFGFSSREDAAAASIREGFPVYAIQTSVLKDGGTHFGRDILEETGNWCFLLNTKEGAKMVITVKRINDEWRAVSFGAAGLARRIESCIREFTVEMGFSFRFIGDSSQRVRYVELSQNQQKLGFLALNSLDQDQASVSDRYPLLMDEGIFISRVREGKTIDQVR